MIDTCHPACLAGPDYDVIYPTKGASVCSFCGRPGTSAEPLAPLVLPAERGGIAVHPFFCHVDADWLVDWIRGTLVERGMISPEDPDLVQLVDTAEEAWAMLQGPMAEAEAQVTALVSEFLHDSHNFQPVNWDKDKEEEKTPADNGKPKKTASGGLQTGRKTMWKSRLC